MRLLREIAVACTLLFAGLSVASATSISGSISVGGTNSFTSTSITFDPATGVVLGVAGPQTSAFLGDVVQLTSFTFSAANNVAIFTASNLLDTLSFTINGTVASILGVASNNSPTLTLSGNGTFTEVPTALGLSLGGTAYTPTTGTFSLTSSTTGITSFQLVSTAFAVTPEPGTMLLLATGLTGIAGMLVRRRRALSV